MLRTHMEKNRLGPTGRIVSDNKSHEYDVCIDGKRRRARYIATPYPLADDPAGPALICSYGLIDEVRQHSYSSLIKK